MTLCRFSSIGTLLFTVFLFVSSSAHADRPSLGELKEKLTALSDKVVTLEDFRASAQSEMDALSNDNEMIHEKIQSLEGVIAGKGYRVWTQPFQHPVPSHAYNTIFSNDTQDDIELALTAVGTTGSINIFTRGPETNQFSELARTYAGKSGILSTLVVTIPPSYEYRVLRKSSKPGGGSPYVISWFVLRHQN